MRIRGAIVAVVIGIIATLLYANTRGTFDDNFTLTIEADAVGEGLGPGAEVKLHGLAIGTVQEVRSEGYERQSMTLSLEPGQAAALSADVAAQFTSSNVFGSTAIELVSNPEGPRLQRNQTLRIEAGAQNVTVTSVLRKVSAITGTLDSEKIDGLLDILSQNASLVGPVTKSIFELAKIVADTQRAPLSQTLGIGADVVNGLDGLAPPAIELIDGVLDASTFLSQPGGADRTNGAIQGADELLVRVGTLLEHNSSGLSEILSAVTDVLVPIAFAAGRRAGLRPHICAARQGARSVPDR